MTDIDESVNIAKSEINKLINKYLELKSQGKRKEAEKFLVAIEYLKKQCKI